MVAYQLWMQKKHALSCEQVPAVLWADPLTGSRAVLGADTHCCGPPHAYGDRSCQMFQGRSPANATKRRKG